MACQLTNNSNLDISDFEDTIQSLVSFSQDRFGFEKPPSLFLNSDTSNASDPLGKTAYYNPESQEIHIYVDERHPKDIMRSISHELIHHIQNLRGDLSGNHYHGEGYAQKDEHMREMEREAYEKGNLCFRDFEDKLKLDKTTYNEWRTNKMSLKEWKNNELFTLLSSKWGFAKNVVTEEKQITHMCALKVTHKESGQVGHPIKHTLTESGDISHYTVEFNKVIVENIAVENLDIMVQEEHTHEMHDEKPCDEEKSVVKEEELEMVDCGDKGRVPKYACDGEGASDLKEDESVISEWYADRLNDDDEVAAHFADLYRKGEMGEPAPKRAERILKRRPDLAFDAKAFAAYIIDKDSKNLTLTDDEIIKGFTNPLEEETLKEAIKRRFARLIK